MRHFPSWVYVLTFAVVASSAATLAVVGVTALQALTLGEPYATGLTVLIDPPLSLAFSWAYGLMPAALAGGVAAIARRGGTRRRFLLACMLAGGVTSALFCIPWVVSVSAAAIGAAYGATGAVVAALSTRGLVRRVTANA